MHVCRGSDDIHIGEIYPHLLKAQAEALLSAAPGLLDACDALFGDVDEDLPILHEAGASIMSMEKRCY